jgi:5-methylcytosine-specific restriction endonuclease McrA
VSWAKLDDAMGEGRGPTSLANPLDSLGFLAQTPEAVRAAGQEFVDRLAAMPYRDYLRTPEWRAVRERALMRDGHRCRLCNAPDNLNVHHRTYARRGDESLEDLTTLCRGCHEHFHGASG